MRIVIERVATQEEVSLTYFCRAAINEMILHMPCRKRQRYGGRKPVIAHVQNFRKTPPGQRKATSARLQYADKKFCMLKMAKEQW